jgi:hypothetical protein
MTKQEALQWAITIFVFATVFVFVFIWRFTTYCIFEWPIRWDVKTCWNEQIAPSSQKAAEQAANFAP